MSRHRWPSLASRRHRGRAEPVAIDLTTGPGDYAAVVHLTAPLATMTAEADASVADGDITLTPLITLTSSDTTTFSGTVATFSDGLGVDSSLLTAPIDWGNGDASTATLTSIGTHS